MKYFRDDKKGKPIAVLGLSGNAESMAYANEIHAFLKANRLPVMESEAAHMFFNPPVFTVNISPFNRGEEWHVVVGPAE